MLRELGRDLRELLRQRCDHLPRGSGGRSARGPRVLLLQDGQEVRLHGGQDLRHEAAALATERQVRGRDLLEHLLLHGLTAEDQRVRLLVEEAQQVAHALDDLPRQRLKVPAEPCVGVEQLHQGEYRWHHDEGQAIDMEVALHPLLLRGVSLAGQLPAKKLFEDVLVFCGHIRPLPTLLLQDALHLGHSLLIELLDNVLRLCVEDGTHACPDIGPDNRVLWIQLVLALFLQAPHLVQSLIRESQEALPIADLQR
mmetsp:Transcript_82250/g.266588  ORF Transcript_82250/g.266588 Transcript_82250/m.266588 type:complete len:254 (+) Transcript_82250:638-1399(+)